MKAGTWAMRTLLGAMVVMTANATFAGQAGATPGARRGGAAAAGAANPNKAKLLTPAQLTEKAPDSYKAKFDTTKGLVVIEVHREWAPLGADRFYNLVKNGFYDDIRFFRVLDGFMAQFGMHGDPSIQSAWGRSNFMDDPVKQSNKRGYVTFAKSSAPNSRSTQVFINFVDNASLDGQGFAPFGQVVEGMDKVDKLYSGYGRQNVPDQGRITTEGNAYLAKEYPRLDYIKKATVE